MVAKQENQERKLALMQQDIEIIKRMGKIKHKIAVMSGKGGLGKSTVSVNIAAALHKKDYKTGTMDADIHGPNVTKMFGVEGNSLKFDKSGIILIVTDEGIKVMSIGFLLPSQEAPVIWRGPAQTGAIRQFLAEIVWGDLDILIIGNPPVMGDIPLTLLQTLPSLDGVVLVTTPQSVVQEDVEKSVNLVKNLNIPIIGIIENMSGFICS